MTTFGMHDAISAVPVLADARFVRKLAGGPVSDSWLLDVQGRGVVLRADKYLAGMLELDRKAELEVLAQVAAAGFGPSVVWADPQNGLLATEYVPGRNWDSATARHPESIKKLAIRLQQLHTAKITAPRLQIEAAARRYSELAGTLRGKQLFDELRVALVPLHSDFSVLGFCHNDAGYQNIVEGERIILLDWEYAGIGCPWFEQAGAVLQNTYSPEDARAFLVAYHGYCDQHLLKRLAAFCRLYDLVSALWYEALRAISDNMANSQQSRAIAERLKANSY